MKEMYNNYDEEDLLMLSELWATGKVSYIVAGLEVGAEGTPHVQGYLELVKRQRGSTLLGSLPYGTHLELRRGSSEEAAEYCKKEAEHVYEEGQLSSCRPGKRTDLLRIQEELDNGAEEKDIADTYFSRWVVYRRSFQAYQNLYHEVREWVPKVFVLCGTTGTGKSRIAYKYGGRRMYTCLDNTFRWFDGYCGHSHVLMDDFSGEGANLPYMLRLLDRYYMTVQVKGGTVNWAPKVIYITTNLSPEQWFPGNSILQIDALKRRITQIIVMNQEPEWTGDGFPIGEQFLHLQ